jgi:HAD superfamily hydrolase (TIGR01509 family)
MRRPVPAEGAGVPDAVVFDLDGVLVDSESTWSEAKRGLVEARGGHWLPEATTVMMGMSSPEWAGYLRDELGVDLPLDAISDDVVGRMASIYRRHLPLLPGAVEAVRALAERWPLGLATSSNRSLIDLVLSSAGLTGAFEVTVSSEEVDRGKPAPDVYLEAARRLGVDPHRCVAVEDSSNGLRAAAAAGMTVVALPNRDFPPAADALALAAATLRSLDELRPPLVDRLRSRVTPPGDSRADAPG